MIWTRNRRQPRPDTIAALYGMIVAQARSPSFYRDFGVADTVNGRFDLIVLHMAIFLHRLSREGEAWREISQHVFNAFCDDMDGNLREIGISDIRVPAQMQRVGEAFYGRARAYDAAFGSGDDTQLEAALSRNIYDAENVPSARQLTTYVRAAVLALAERDAAAIANGEFRFPEPMSAVAS